jgi:hypothetical protein
MRGKVSDQDLTNYALNELPPEERLYVESMLGVSEECRGDVYQMLELGEMLKEGFEADEAGAEILLNEEQRTKVLDVPRWNWKGLLQQAAAITLLAAGTAYTVTRPAFWQKGGAADKISDAGEAVKGWARNADEFTSRLQSGSVAKPEETSSPMLAEEGSEWQFVATPAICTPPTPMVVEM